MQEGGLLNSEANVNLLRSNLVTGWWAVLGLVWTGVVVANELQKTVSDLVLHSLVVFVIDSNPWNPFVWWVEGLGLEGDLVLKSSSISTLVAGHDFVEVFDLSFVSTLGGNTLVIGSSIKSLDTVQEIEELDWALNKALGAGLEVVVLALGCSVLASEFPSGGSLLLVSISIWPEVEVSHVQESVSLHGIGKGSSDHLLAAWALTLIVEVNHNLIVVSLLL